VVRVVGKDKVTGTVLLFATHFMFVDGKGEETWVRHHMPFILINMLLLNIIIFTNHSYLKLIVLSFDQRILCEYYANSTLFEAMMMVLLALTGAIHEDRDHQEERDDC
jgi:hypothetical protein